MTSPRLQAEIIGELEANAGRIAEFFSAQPDFLLYTGDTEHWGPAHHLAHLTRTGRAITRGLLSSDRPLHPTGRSRAYGELIALATAGVQSTPKERLLEMGRVVVVEPGAGGAALVSDFVAAGTELRAAAATWSEEELDRHSMRHPLIGALTVREMLLFCIFHERHHLQLVRKRLEATP